MKRFTSFTLILLALFLVNTGFAQNMTQGNDLGALQKASEPNFACQAKVLEYSALKDSRTPLNGVNIEVFNLTSQKLELKLENHPLDKFSFNFRQGNRYTIMLRKEGYLIKRINAKIGVDGCKACFDGLNILTPLENNEVNSIMNLQLMMRKINEGDRVLMPEIAFEGKSAQITEKTGLALNDLAILLKDNPNILGQLEIHTDARGDADENMKLSKERARAIKNYLSLSGINRDDISIRSYGERRIINNCYSESDCNEAQHAQNRRTIFWLRAQIGENNKYSTSLVDILATEGSANFSAQARVGAINQKTKQEETIAKEEVAVAKPLAKPAVPVQKKEVASVAKVDKAIPKANLGENKLFGSSSFSNTIAVKPEEVKAICDVNGVMKSNKKMHDLAEEEEGLGLQISRAAKDKVTTIGNTSEMVNVTYEEDGSKIVRLSGRASLISLTYTGYMIEMFTSDEELPNNHKVFERHGKVLLDDTGTAFSYMLGGFETKESAEKFIKTVVRFSYPDAKVIRYKEGSRKN